MCKNNLILNPATSDYVFGRMPPIKYKGKIHYQEGLIYLRHGEHRVPNKGFGVQHIWAEHEVELKMMGYEGIDSVAQYVSDIIVYQGPVYCNFQTKRSKIRMSVIKSDKGLAIIEHKIDGNNNPYYSVVTAFDKKTAQGTMVGRVRRV